MDERFPGLLRPFLKFAGTRPLTADADLHELGLDSMREMLAHPLTVLGGSDGGAHCATASDASMPSFMLTHWVRDRPHGRLPLELVVHKMSGATAQV